jgi:hypothetical protein
MRGAGLERPQQHPQKHVDFVIVIPTLPPSDRQDGVAASKGGGKLPASAKGQLPSGKRRPDIAFASSGGPGGYTLALPLATACGAVAAQQCPRDLSGHYLVPKKHEGLEACHDFIAHSNTAACKAMRPHLLSCSSVACDFL